MVREDRDWLWWGDMCTARWCELGVEWICCLFVSTWCRLMCVKNILVLISLRCVDVSCEQTSRCCIVTAVKEESEVDWTTIRVREQQASWWVCICGLFSSVQFSFAVCCCSKLGVIGLEYLNLKWKSAMQAACMCQAAALALTLKTGSVFWHFVSLIVYHTS